MRGWEIRILNSALTTVAVVYNPTADLPSGACRVEEEVEGQDKITLTVYDLDTYLTNVTAEQAYIRLINLADPTEIRTYAIEDHKTIHDANGRGIQLEGLRIWVHLQDRYFYRSTKDFANIALGTLLADVLASSGASTEFQIGTVATSTEVVDFFEVNWHSALWCFRTLCAKMGREMSIDESTTPITLNFPATIGSATNARIIYGVNLQGITRRVDKSNMATRLYAIGGGDPAMKLSASSLAGGAEYVEDAAAHALYGKVGVYQNADLEDIENLIPAASCPDLSGTYTAGLCAGWAKIGSPTVTENTTATYIQQGTKSQKVVAAVTEGVSVTFTAPANTRLVSWVNVYVDVFDVLGKLVVEVTDGTARFLNGDGIEAPSPGFAAEERRGIEFTGTSVTLKIYMKGGGGTFYVDAAFCAAADEFKKFVIGDMADVLYNEAVDELAARKVPETTYTIEALDLYETDPLKWPDYEIRLGDTVVVVDDDLSIVASQRIKARTWDVIHPENTGFEVGNIQASLGSLLTSSAQVTRRGNDRAGITQDKSERVGAAMSLDRPLTAQIARFSGVFSSTAYNAFSWTAGTLTVGTDVVYAIGSGSSSGLLASTTYYLYFDLDAPGSSLQVTTTYATSVGPRKASVATVVTAGATEAGCTIITTADGKPQLSGGDIVTGVLLANKCLVRAPGSSSAKVEIDSTGLKGYNTAGLNTFEVLTDGTGRLGAAAGSPITWDAAGALTVPGGIVTTGINAGNITTGVLSVGASPSANDRITIDWSTEDLVLYRGGSQVVDLGDISTSLGYAQYGMRVSHPEAAVILERSGSVGAVPGSDSPLGFVCSVTRAADEASTNSELGYQCVMSLGNNTGGTNGAAVGYNARVTNLDGITFGFNAQIATGTTEARGVNTNAIASAAAGNAYGLYVNAAQGGASGSGIGIYIADGISGGGTNYAFYSASVEDSLLSGKLKTRALEPTADATYDIGAEANRYKAGYFNDYVVIGPRDASANPAILALHAGSTGQPVIQMFRQTTTKWQFGVNDIFGTDGLYFYDDVNDRYSAGLPTTGDFELTQQGKGVVVIPDNANGATCVDDLTKKRLSITKMASPPTQGAWMQFQNSPGSDSFYLVLGDV